MTERLVFIAYTIKKDVAFEDIRQALNRYKLDHVGFRLKRLDDVTLMMVHFPRATRELKNKKNERLIHRALKEAPIEAKSYGVAELKERAVLSLSGQGLENNLHPGDRFYFESRRDLFQNIGARLSRIVTMIGRKRGVEIHAEHKPFLKQSLYDVELFELFPRWLVEREGGTFEPSLTREVIHELTVESAKELARIKESATSRARRRNEEMFIENRVSHIYMETDLDTTNLRRDVEKEVYGRMKLEGNTFVIANPYRSHPKDNVTINFEESAHLDVREYVTHFLKGVDEGMVITKDSWQQKTYKKMGEHVIIEEEVLLKEECSHE